MIGAGSAAGWSGEHGRTEVHTQGLDRVEGAGLRNMRGVGARGGGREGEGRCRGEEDLDTEGDRPIARLRAVVAQLHAAESPEWVRTLGVATACR